MEVALALYPKFTMLDIVGPFQVLADLPDVEIRWVTSSPGSVVDHTGHSGLMATSSLDDVPRPDVVIVPGGFGDTELDRELVAWLRRVHETTTWTTSVCTGSIYLAAAGILTGVDASTHWSRTERLEQLGAHYVPERVVERGKIITAAGVSSGIDMGLVLVERLFGRDQAQTMQLAIEYDPQPPFDAGSPAKAPKEIVDFLRLIMADTLSDEAVVKVVSNVGGTR